MSLRAAGLSMQVAPGGLGFLWFGGDGVPRILPLSPNPSGSGTVSSSHLLPSTRIPLVPRMTRKRPPLVCAPQCWEAGGRIKVNAGPCAPAATPTSLVKEEF